MLPQKKYEETDVFWEYFAMPDKKAANDNRPKSELENIAEQDTGNKPSSNVVYLDDYRQKRQNADYLSTMGTYLKKREQALNDFSDRVPGKHVSTFSRNEMPGVLGFTYLGQDRMALRDDLTGKTKKMVDIHESIHTPDELETRYITSWIMSKSRSRYIR